MGEGDIFLDQYDGQTVDELIQLQKTHRIDSIVLAFEAALDSRKEKGEEISEVELTILAIEAFDREINNGGFGQFFYNSSVEYTPIIVKCLNSIGCNELAALAQKSIDILNVESLDPDSIEQKMDPDDDELEEALSELDDIFYDTEEAIAYALFEYIKSNRLNISLSNEKIRFA